MPTRYSPAYRGRFGVATSDADDVEEITAAEAVNVTDVGAGFTAWAATGKARPAPNIPSRTPQTHRTRQTGRLTPHPAVVAGSSRYRHRPPAPTGIIAPSPIRPNVRGGYGL
jgi:hypothetical protein